jgi:UDP-N-acetyl-D-galactosamine dehydrogenase
MVHDPLGDPHEAYEEYKIRIVALDQLVNLDAIILAVAHREYVANVGAIFERVRDNGVVIDVKSALPAGTKPPRGIRLWSL